MRTRPTGRRIHGCGYCQPVPCPHRRGGPPCTGCDSPEPDPTCLDCRAREWAMFPGVDLDRAEWQTISGLLDLRSGGRCEGCGKPFVPGVREPNRHHRRARGMGGSSDYAINGLANLLLLCAGANGRLGGAAAGCHASVNDTGDGLRRGLVVPWGDYLGNTGQPPPEVNQPLILASGRRVLLDPLTPYYLPAPGPAYAA